MDQLAMETLDHDIDPLTTVHFADLKPLVNSYIQQEVQIRWDVSIHCRDLYLLKPTLGPPKRFRHLTRAEVVITWLWIGHTKATKSHILSRGPPTACQHCAQTLTIEGTVVGGLLAWCPWGWHQLEVTPMGIRRPRWVWDLCGKIPTPDPQSPWLSEGVGSGWSGLYGGPLRPYTCEPYPTQLVCRELRPEGLVAWCPGMLRYGWQVHNMAHKSPGSIYILWSRPTW